MGGTSGGGAGGSGGTPAWPQPPPLNNSCGFANIVSKAMFDTIYPVRNRNPVYTYETLVEATKAFPRFAMLGDLDNCRKEAAAFLAHVGHETGKLKAVEETMKAPYCSPRPPACDCDPMATDTARMYYGRGAIQLSWNYNYCAAGNYFKVDLLAQPNLVSTDGVLAWKTALWFWMDREGAGTMTCHMAMNTAAGFGETIRSVNGSKNCNMGGYGVKEGVTERVDAFLDIARRLGVMNPGSPMDLDC